MGFVSMNENLHAVFDSGPLIHLSEIGALSLLDIFPMRVTTDIVVAEVERYLPPGDVVDFFGNDTIKIIKVGV